MSKQFIPKLLASVILAAIFASGSVTQLNGALRTTIATSDDYAATLEAINSAFDSHTISLSTTARDYWPTTAWQYSTPEELGMNSTMLEDMMEFVRNERLALDSVVIVRNGYVVFEEYPHPRVFHQNSTHNLYSATKSVSSMLIGIALAESYIDNVQHKLVDFFPNRSIANMDSRKQAITLEHVLTMSSGLQWDEWTYGLGDPRDSITQMINSPDWVQFVLDLPMAHNPGTVWTYSGGGSHLLSAIIGETVEMSSPWQFAREQLFDPLGITVWRWDIDGFVPYGFSHLFLRPLDMAKLGFLYLNKGAWDGEQIVPAEWVETSTIARYSVFPDVDYGYQWWMHPSTGLYWAWGMAGQRIAVVPDYDMVIVFTGSLTDYDPGDYLINNYILPAAPAPPIVVPDDFPTIQEAINSATDGATVLVRAGTYYEHVVVNKTVSLVGEDVSTTIVDGNGTGHTINVVRDNVSISGFTVQNSGSTHWPYLDAGICLNGTVGCTVSGNRLVDNGFYDVSLLDSDRNTITCNNMSGASWGGVHLMNSTRNLVYANVIADKNGGGVNGHVSSNYNNITENVISNCTYGMFYHASNHNSICGNNISAIAVEGIWFQDQVNYNLVAGNNLINNTVAIRLEGPNYNNTLSRNVITGAEYGIKIENSARYTRIVDNIIMGNRAGNDSWSAGIRLDSGLDSQIHSNTITGNNYGVLLYSNSPRVSIYNNTIAGNEFGIRVSSGGSSYLNVSNNVIMNNRGYGIGLTGFGGASNYATISGNHIVNNSDGIALGRYSNYHQIFRNNVSQNGYGFYIEYSTGNVIWANNVIGNDQQVHISAGSVNTWDNSYPSGGNYWSDYSGVDLYSGSSQNESGSDGIGDDSSVIDSANRDNYPLMNPWASPDIAVVSLAASRNFVFQGSGLAFNLTVQNHGYKIEGFNLAIHANAMMIQSQYHSLTGGNSTVVILMWNTSGFALGNYTLTAAVSTLPGEANITNNLLVNGMITIRRLGDLDGDNTVDGSDIMILTRSFGSFPGHPTWKANADMNEDGVVDGADMIITCRHFGEPDP